MAKTKKNILIVSQGFWPEVFPINDIAANLSKFNFNIDILTGKPNYPQGKIFKGYKFLGIQQEKFKSNCNIIRVPIIPRGNSSPLKIIINYFSFIISGIILGSWALRSKKYDSILVFAPSPIFQAIVGLYFKLIKKTKIIVWVQDLWPEVLFETGYIKNRSILKIIRYFVKKVYVNSDLILAQSQSFVKEIKKFKPNVPVLFLPNPGKIFFKSRNYKRSKKNKKFNVVFAGNLGKAQSVETILETALLLKKNSNIIFTLIGTGKMYNWLKEQIKVKNVHNIFLKGRVKDALLLKMFLQCSALLITLKNGKILNKTIPSKLQTYMSLGKPIIGSLNGETSNIIKISKSGLVSPAEKSKELAKNIIKMSKMSKNRLNQMGISGMSYYKKNFKLNMLTLKLTNIIRKLI